MWRRAIMGAVLLSLVPDAAAARFLWFGKKKQVERVNVVPVKTPAGIPRAEPPLAGRTTCVDVRRLAGAQVFGDAAVEVTLQGGARWRMYFEQGCPALDFYKGFYYRRAEQGRLCAGRDAIISRAGGECQIASIVQTHKPRVKKRRPHR